jgi:three-Cys-motif partner protein
LTAHRFGGTWTERKLAALRDYLIQYQIIFTKNPSAKNLRTVYVDAFAGTGERDARIDKATVSLFGYDEDAKKFQQGSASVALGLQNKFHRYIFIDLKTQHIGSLKKIVEKDFPEMSPICEFLHEDANTWLQAWCAGQNWHAQRAVVFLDPYGMSVAWETIEAIARTKAIDLWILFPFAIGANRMTPSVVLPEKDWAVILTKVFGTTDWIKRFYETKTDTDLFGNQRNSITKIVGADEILGFFLERLRGVFPHVVSKPLILYNSHNSPMYALCFAAGNPKGGKTALKIASHLARSR